MSSNARPNPLAAQPGQPGIDPRGPRFGATITVITLLIELVLLLGANSGIALGNSIAANWLSPAGLLLSFIVLIFGIGAFAGIQKHPYGFLFKKIVRPRLQAPTELENPKPPTFAQLIGFIIAAADLVFLSSRQPQMQEAGFHLLMKASGQLLNFHALRVTARLDVGQCRGDDRHVEQQHEHHDADRGQGQSGAHT